MSAISEDLKKLLKTSDVQDGTAELRTYAFDASYLTQLSPHPPQAAVVARSIEDVQEVMRYATERGIPVAPRGAASAMTGGAVALTGGIVLSLNAMDKLLEVDVPNLQVHVEPGIVLALLNQQIQPHGLLFPVDPGSSKMATLGGMASTNAHGMRAVKYGSTANWVLGLDFVLPTGERIQTGSVNSRTKQSSSGVELTKLFVGAEGIFGVIVGLRLKVMTIPLSRTIVLALFDTLEKAGEAVQRVFQAGITPSAMEILDHNTLISLNIYRPALKLPEVEAALLFEVDGNPPGVEYDGELIMSTLKGLAISTERSSEPLRMAALWEARTLVGASMSSLRPGSRRAYIAEDICVPVAQIPKALRGVHEILARNGVVGATYGHIGGGSLHPALLVDSKDAEDVARVLKAADEINLLALELGGSVTGEHGVGAARAQYMPAEHGPALDVMRRLKASLDPAGIMNPGVIFPETVPKMDYIITANTSAGERPYEGLDPG